MAKSSSEVDELEAASESVEEHPPVEEVEEELTREFSIYELELFVRISEIWEKILRGELEPEEISELSAKVSRARRRRSSATS